MKKSIALTFLVIGAIVDIIDFTLDIKRILVNWLGINMDTAASIRLGIILIASFFIIVSLHYLYKVMEKKLFDAGTHKIPCAFVPYLRYKACYKIIALLRIMHCDLYHILAEAKKEILRKKQQRPQDQRNNPLSASEARTELSQLLSSFHAIVYNLFKLDLSVSLYLSEMEGENTVLTRCLFLQSRREQNRGQNRQLNYKYIINNCNSQDVSDYAAEAELYTRHNRGTHYKKNSIFDYVLTSSNPSWTSNDLIIDEKNKKFYSSSEYYKQRYNSLAVFAIIPPSNANNPHNAIKGLLTFDSQKTNVFCEEECTLLMGLMAHHLYELLECLK